MTGLIGASGTVLPPGTTSPNGVPGEKTPPTWRTGITTSSAMADNPRHRMKDSSSAITGFVPTAGTSLAFGNRMLVATQKPPAFLVMKTRSPIVPFDP
jgi:hypothetical protein